MKKILITGMSGTGKTTVAEELQKKNIHTISIDEVDGLCSWFNKNTGHRVDYHTTLNDEFVNNHDWICDISQLIKLIEGSNEMSIVLGAPSNQKDLLPLFDKVLLLRCPPEIFLERIQKRTDNIFGKDKTTQKLLREWYTSFEKEMLDAGAIQIDATRPIEEVVDQVLKEIE